MSIPSYEDLCQVPDRFIAQIIHGQLIALPRPAPKHARAATCKHWKYSL
ncbi:hypothetical protein CCP3SC15_2770001 [Gammaproteobacteria bacterium]